MINHCRSKRGATSDINDRHIQWKGFSENEVAAHIPFV